MEPSKDNSLQLRGIDGLEMAWKQTMNHVGRRIPVNLPMKELAGLCD